MTDKVEEDTNQEEDYGSIEPGCKLQGAGYSIAHHSIDQEWNGGGTRSVPPDLICSLSNKTWCNKYEEYCKRALYLLFTDIHTSEPSKRYTYIYV
ncbi:hypothetical protein Hanom_Chr06g00536231 [Helianthus anomalus]